MDALEEVKQRLNEASDKLTARIVEEEAAFKTMGLGVQTWIELGDKKQFLLGYTNETGEWGLYLRKLDEDKELQWRLSTAPRGLRLYALRRIGLLREAVIKHAISLTTRIERFLEDGTGDDHV
jgi:hypothetical protein